MKKDTKSLIAIVTGTFIVGIGSELITPSSVLIGAIIGLVGCGIFFIGAFSTLKSMLKKLPEMIKLSKEAINSRKG